MMKNNILLLFLILALSACTNQLKKPIDSTLPILDVTKEYPKKKIDIHEIADVEYIPLETTDESVLSVSTAWKISDKFIILKDHGTIHIFDRKGKHLYKHCNIGQGPNEHGNFIFLFTVDFKDEEFYIYDRRKIQVYDFTGKWKRTLKIPEDMMYSSMFDYNEQYLIAYNLPFDYYNFENPLDDKHPYYLIDKQDGTHVPLDITLNNIDKREFTETNNFIRACAIRMAFITPILTNNHDILIADYRLDTLYNYKEKELKAIAIQYPSVYGQKDKTPTIVGAVGYSDQYLFFKPVKMEYDSKHVHKPYIDAPLLMWDRNTNEIFNVQLFDSNIIEDKKTRIFMQLGRDIAFETSNCFHNLYHAEALIEEYEAGNLKGELKDIASKLKYDDNEVCVICKLK